MAKITIEEVSSKFEDFYFTNLSSFPDLSVKESWVTGPPLSELKYRIADILKSTSARASRFMIKVFSEQCTIYTKEAVMNIEKNPFDDMEAIEDAHGWFFAKGFSKKEATFIYTTIKSARIDAENPATLHMLLRQMAAILRSTASINLTWNGIPPLVVRIIGCVLITVGLQSEAFEEQISPLSVEKAACIALSLIIFQYATGISINYSLDDLFVDISWEEARETFKEDRAKRLISLVLMGSESSKQNQQNHKNFLKSDSNRSYPLRDGISQETTSSYTILDRALARRFIRRRWYE